jgi:hypothetical protein
MFMWERHLAANMIEAGRLSHSLGCLPGFMWLRPNETYFCQPL